MKKKRAHRVFAACCDKLDSVRLEKFTPRYGDNLRDTYQVVVECMKREPESFHVEFLAAREVAKQYGCKMTVDAENEGVTVTLWGRV